MISEPPIDALLSAILRGELVDLSALAAYDAESFCADAARHDVLPLVADRLTARADLPTEWRARLTDAAHQAIVRDMTREVELRHVLSALSDAGVKPLLVKGCALAYTHYARPELRSRIDSDILIPPADRETVHAILVDRLGYVASLKPSGELTATQTLYGKWAGEVAIHALDVHWRLASPQVFAHVLSYDDLAARASAVSRLGPDAFGPCPVHALLVACVHRVAHHADSVRFKWLYDIHLLASRFTDGEWDDFVVLAQQRHVLAVCRHSLESAAVWFHTPMPDRVRSAARGDDEAPTAAYLAPQSRAHAVAADLRALSSWRDRARLVREHVFPPADYMRRMYAPSSVVPLPVLYVLRFFRGARKWLRSA